MDTFKTFLNPLYSLIRGGLGLAALISAFYIAYRFATDVVAGEIASNSIGLFISGPYLLMGSAMAGLFLSEAVDEFRTFTINEQAITVYNYLTFTETTYYSHQVRGYSTSHFPSGGWRFGAIILYLENGEKVELRQFCFLNFKKIAPALKATGYQYFGYEPFRWKFFNKRHFKFEGEMA